jgi:hypothetical protein
MTGSPDSRVSSAAGLPAAEKRDDKAFIRRQEGEADRRAAKQVNAVSAKRSLTRFGVQREWNRIAGTVYRA